MGFILISRHVPEKNDIELSLSISNQYSIFGNKMIIKLKTAKTKILLFTKSVINQVQIKCKATLKELETHQNFFSKFIGLKKASETFKKEADKSLTAHLKLTNNFFDIHKEFENVCSKTKVFLTIQSDFIHARSYHNFNVEIRRGNLNNQKVVIKNYTNMNCQHSETINNEIKIIKKCSELADLGQPFLKCFGVNFDSQGNQISLESFGTDLKNKMQKMKSKNKQFTEEELRKMVERLIQGFCLLEVFKINHQDINASNILVHGSGKNIDVKIIDFKYFEVEKNYLPFNSTSIMETNSQNRVPELVNRIYPVSNNFFPDVYSLGLVILQMGDVFYDIYALEDQV